MIYIYNSNGMNSFHKSQIFSSVLSIIIGLSISLLAGFAFEAMAQIIFTIIGCGIILTSIFPLIMAISGIQEDRRYILDLVFSIISIVLGIMFIFNHGVVLSIIFGVYLIIMPIIRIALSNNRMLQLKQEAPLFIAAILLFFNTIDSVLRIGLIVMGAIVAILGLVNLVMELIRNSKHDDFNNTSNPFNSNGKRDNDDVIIDAEVRDL